jgi:hypothetical protein
MSALGVGRVRKDDKLKQIEKAASKNKPWGINKSEENFS